MEYRRLIRFALAAFCVFGSIASPATSRADTAKQSAAPPTIDPKDITSDAKLTPAVAKLMLVCANSYNAKDYSAARSVIAELKAVPNRSTYDDFNIANLELLIAGAAQDPRAGAGAVERMAMSPALTDRDRKAVFKNAVFYNAALKEYWHAIQYGELLKREGRLDGEAAFLLPFLYFQDSAFADAEQSAQFALSNSTFPADEKEKLTKLVGMSQIKQGKVAPMPSSFGESLLKAFGAGLVEGMTGQRPNDDPQAEMQEQQAASATALQQAMQHAAGQVLAADPAAERAVYDDLVHKPALTAAATAQAQDIFGRAFDAYQRKDYASAEKGFAEGLAIDPTNAAGNYYYADCLASQGGNSLVVIDYLTRALVLGENVDETKMARTALQQYASAH
jgi:hypothetical protein